MHLCIYLVVCLSTDPIIPIMEKCVLSRKSNPVYASIYLSSRFITTDPMSIHDGKMTIQSKIKSDLSIYLSITSGLSVNCALFIFPFVMKVLSQSPNLIYRSINLCVFSWSDLFCLSVVMYFCLSVHACMHASIHPSVSVCHCLSVCR